MADTSRTPIFGATSRSSNPFGRDRASTVPVAGTLTIAKNSPIAPAAADLADFRDSLGRITAMMLNYRTRKEAREAAVHAYRQLIEAKKELLVYNITLGLDASKKALFLESLAHSNAMDREIQAISSEFAQGIAGTALDLATGVAEEKKRRLDDLDARLTAGRITAEDHAALRETIGDATRGVTDIISNIAGSLVSGHVARLQMTLELFKERLERDAREGGHRLPPPE